MPHPPTEHLASDCRASDFQLYQVLNTHAPDFDYQRWGRFLQHWTREDASGVAYAPFGAYKSVALKNTELVGLKRNLPSLLVRLCKTVNALLRDESRFFRLSTRSPKDAWISLAPELGVNDTDDAFTSQTKLTAQMRLCKVKSFEDVRRLVVNSERVQEDLDYHIEHAPPGDVMNLVFPQWRCIGREVRVFIADRKILEACPYQPKTWSTEDVSKLQDKRDGLHVFVQDLSQMLPPVYHTAVVDVFFDDLDRVHLVELNPFDRTTDPILYTWDHLHDLAH